MPPAENKLVFRSVMGWVWFGLATAIAAFLLVDMAIRGSVWDAFLVAPWLAAICWVVWVFQVVPRIEADDSAARLFNLLRVIDVPWGTVAEVRLRYNVEFTLRQGGKITAWGGSSRRLHRSIGRRSAEDPADSEAEALQRLHSHADGSPGAVTKTWDWPSIAAAIVIAAWLVFSVTQTNGIVLPA